jgi:hypothetical protein
MQKFQAAFFLRPFSPAGMIAHGWCKIKRGFLFLQDRIFILHFNQFYTVFTLTKCKITDMILQFYRIAGFENLPAEFLGP